MVKQLESGRKSATPGEWFMSRHPGEWNGGFDICFCDIYCMFAEWSLGSHKNLQKISRHNSGAFIIRVSIGIPAHLLSYKCRLLNTNSAFFLGLYGVIDIMTCLRDRDWITVGHMGVPY